MDYEVGSIADMISGDRTPNRPKVTKKPLTPVKPSTPPSRNVTPRENKGLNKAKTPKIAFTPEVVRTPQSLAKKKQDKSAFDSPKSATKKRKSKLFNTQEPLDSVNEQIQQESQKVIGGKRKSEGNLSVHMKSKSPPKKIKQNTPQVNLKNKQKSKMEVEKNASGSDDDDDIYDQIEDSDNDSEDDSDDELADSDEGMAELDNEDASSEEEEADSEADSEKEEAESEDEKADSDDEEDVSETKVAQGSDDEAEPTEFEVAAAKRVKQKEMREEKFDDRFIDRTLFVGNIPISILKKNHERILRSKFAKYGTIESVRIRNIPVADLTTKPKLALIEKKFHAERSTVIAYILYVDSASIEKAIVENNSVLEGNHLRVDKCYKSGSRPIDPRKSLFCGNLPFNVEEESLREFFSKCGEIESVRIVRDRKTQMGKGIAFINFTSADGVELALSMDEEDLKINNRQFRVKRYAMDNHSKSNNNTKRENNFSKIFANVNQNNKNVNKSPFQNNKKFDRKQQKEQHFGKKRDNQGNKIRKRDQEGGMKFNKNKQQNGSFNNKANGEPNVKKFKKDTEENTDSKEGQNEDKKKNRIERQAEYKGLVAKKKKKMKQNKANLEKKKISKILTQSPKKNISSD